MPTPQTPDSDFEGFDGEHRPPSSGGARSEADKALALLEHRLSGQVKGGTMVSALFQCHEWLAILGVHPFNVDVSCLLCKGLVMGIGRSTHAASSAKASQLIWQNRSCRLWRSS